MAKRNSVAIKADEEWLVEDDMRTLMRCREIEGDPKRMAKVRALAKKKLEEVAGVIAETQEKE